MDRESVALFFYFGIDTFSAFPKSACGYFEKQPQSNTRSKVSLALPPAGRYVIDVFSAETKVVYVQHILRG